MTGGKFFTLEARLAAYAGRRKRVEQRKTAFGQIEVFVVRYGTGISWEVRRFGGVILACGTKCFDTKADAIAAGELVRHAMLAAPT